MEVPTEADSCIAKRSKRRRTAATSLVALLDALLLGCLGLFDFYSLVINVSGHTGMPVMSLAWFYLLVALIGLVLVGASRRGTLSPVAAWVLLGVGVLGFLNLFLFDRLNIMVEYEVMLKRWGK